MKNKSRFNKLQSGFFKTSTKIFSMNLDPTSVALFCYLVSCREDFNPPARYLAKKLRISKTTVTRAMDTLVRRNIIKRIAAAHKGQTAQYEFIDPKYWIETHIEATPPPNDAGPSEAE